MDPFVREFQPDSCGVLVLRGTLKRRERKRRHQVAGVEMARTENAAPKCRGGNGEALSPWGR